MILKKIDDIEFEKFVSKNKYSSFYQSKEWYQFKCNSKRNCELLGLYDNKKLIGVSLIIYVRILKFFSYAYASRGFVYNYENLNGFTSAIKRYFSSNKKVVFFRMDPPIILKEYNKNMEVTIDNFGEKIIKQLKNNSFIHYGYNLGFETLQFRFVNRLLIIDSFSKQLELMNKSTKKNIDIAYKLGVRIKEVNEDDFDEVYRLFESTANRRNITCLSKEYYLNLIKSMKECIIMYIAYIDKKSLLEYLNKEIETNSSELNNLRKKMKNSNVGKKMLNQESILNNKLSRLEKLVVFAKKLSNYTNISSMLCIKKYDEIVSYVSGMDNDYRRFCPKYVLYSEMIKHAIKNNIKYVNFLGVKNIFDKDDKDYGILDIKRGFGGQTIEYIGEFDLPLKKGLYKLFKIKENAERKKMNEVS